MSTPTLISRYPRPLRAIQPFQQPPASQAPLTSSPPSPSPSPSPSFRSNNKCSRTESLSPISSTHDVHSDKGSSSHHLAPPTYPLHSAPRRSSSLSSLEDKWLQYNSENKADQMHNECLHKRSYSCSNAESIKKNISSSSKTTKHHTRRSIEGLNQEVSSVLEGKPLTYTFSHPDGHVAPVQDFLYSCNVNSLPLSPQEFPSSPLQGEIYPMSLDEEPCLVSPKASFVGEGSSSAVGKCEALQENMYLSHCNVPRPPDRSKANIVFNGTAFVPPLLPLKATVSII